MFCCHQLGNMLQEVIFLQKQSTFYYKMYMQKIKAYSFDYEPSFISQLVFFS